VKNVARGAHIAGSIATALLATGAVRAQLAPGPACVGSPVAGASFASPGGGAIADDAATSFTLTVSGVGSYLWDVDLTTFVTHTWCADLDITLTSPAGTTIRIVSDLGGSNDDVFDGTLWDDSAATPVTDAVFTNHVVATPLSPEDSLDAFRGEDPNGVWTLAITDDAAGQTGSLASWQIDVATLASAPYETTSQFARSASLAIAATGTPSVSDTITVAGLGPTLSKVVVYTEIDHTWCSDLDVTLTAPSGKVVILTTDNGGGFDGCFSGTTWNDDVADHCARYDYADSVVATSLAPEGSLGGLRGEDPNGVWTLTVADDSSSDGGQFVKWRLELTTCDGAAAPIAYCTSGTTSNGCIATISADTQPSASFAHACHIAVTGVETQKNGVIFYGIDNSAFAPLPWSPQSTSFLCIKPPYQRTGAQDSAGDPLAGPCEGSLHLDWNAFQLSNAGVLGSPFTAGQDAFVQSWFRDPPAPKTTSLSNALQLTLQP
jgi:subtilisin-like proprotein convertase family protein